MVLGTGSPARIRSAHPSVFEAKPEGRSSVQARPLSRTACSPGRCQAPTLALSRSPAPKAESFTTRRTPAPSPALRPWLADISVISVTAGGGQTLTHLPDAATTLVFRSTADRGGELLVLGPGRRASYHPAKELPLCVKIRIRPGRARPLLGVPVGTLVDRVVPLGELWGADGDRLARELAGLGREPGLVVARLQAALLARLAARTPGDLSRSDLLRSAARAMTVRAQRPEPVPALARQLTVSERQLRNLFAEGVGLSPKQLARIERVRSVLAHPGERLRLRPPPRAPALLTAAAGSGPTCPLSRSAGPVRRRPGTGRPGCPGWPAGPPRRTGRGRAAPGRRTCPG